MIKPFIHNEWEINDTTRLSMAEWEDSNGRITKAVAIKRATNSGWRVDRGTAHECSFDTDDWRHQYWDIDIATKLLHEEMEEVPVRFFRDNVISEEDVE